MISEWSVVTSEDNGLEEPQHCLLFVPPVLQVTRIMAIMECLSMKIRIRARPPVPPLYARGDITLVFVPVISGLDNDDKWQHEAGAGQGTGPFA